MDKKFILLVFKRLTRINIVKNINPFLIKF